MIWTSMAVNTASKAAVNLASRSRIRNRKWRRRRHPHSQRRDDVVDRWATRLPARIGPRLSHQAAMPAQDRVRDEAMAAQRSRQPSDEPDEEHQRWLTS
jgi:hypothetical protein